MIRTLSLVAAFAVAGSALGQSVSATQLPGRKFQIVGQFTSGADTATLSGAASGVSAIRSTGELVTVRNVHTLGLVTVQTNTGQTATVTLANAPPTIPSFAITNNGDGSLTLSGTATDDTPQSLSGLAISFTGPDYVWTTLVQVPANGQWSTKVRIQSKPGDIITAQLPDWYGLMATRSAIVP